MSTAVGEGCGFLIVWDCLPLRLVWGLWISGVDAINISFQSELKVAFWGLYEHRCFSGVDAKTTSFQAEFEVALWGLYEHRCFSVDAMTICFQAEFEAAHWGLLSRHSQRQSIVKCSKIIGNQLMSVESWWQQQQNPAAALINGHWQQQQHEYRSRADDGSSSVTDIWVECELAVEVSFLCLSEIGRCVVKLQPIEVHQMHVLIPRQGLHHQQCG